MATGFLNWSKVSANNTTADANVNWQEGQAPSTVNDSARAMMAALAQYRDDQAGILVTVGGPTAYTVTSNQGYAVPTPQNQSVRVSFNQTNGSNPTLAVDGGTAFPIQNAPGVAIPTSYIVVGTPYDLTFVTNAWIMNHGVNAPIAPNTITRAMLQDGIINGGTGAGVKLDVNTITANNIANATITAAKIANGTITGTQIAATTIAAANIVNNTITAAQIAAGTITATQIAAGTITTTQIAGAAGITGSQIASATIAIGNIATDAAHKNFVIGYDASSGVATQFPRVFESLFIQVQEQQASGAVQTGSVLVGAYRTRTLNTLLANGISGASLGGNQVTLPAGTYFAMGYVTSGVSGSSNSSSAMRCKLQNVTGGTTLLLGSAAMSTANISNICNIVSHVRGQFTLGGGAALELQTYHTAAGGSGPSVAQPVTTGDAEVYIDLIIWKTA